MKNSLLTLLIWIICPVIIFGQEIPKIDTIPPKIKYWKLSGLMGVNGTQTSFVNWSAGGRNNVSVLAFFSGIAEYKKGPWLWKNNMDLALGGLLYMDSLGKKQGLQKTDDKIDLATNLGHRIKEHWFISMVGTFRSQFLNGYSYPNDSVKVSTFMAPGYLSLALGIDYTPDPSFSIFLSPISTKMTFVRATELSNRGMFGVDAATYNDLGEMITAGKKFRGEFGAYFRMTYQKELFKNVNFRGRVELFSNYLNKPQNVDINADVLWTFKVNNWLSASLNWTLIYDDDIKIRDSKGGYGPRMQFKSVLGLGLAYTIRNFKDAKK